MKKILYFLLTSLLIISLVFAFTACKDNGDTPGEDSGNTPGGDVSDTPGGDSGNTPGGDVSDTPGGDIGDDPNDEHTHSYTEKVADKEYLANAATCTEPASYYYSCECGEIMDDGETFTHGEPLGHDMIEMDTTHPTCTEDGSLKVVCSRCGITETTTITATGHTFFEGSCINCGAADPDYVPVCEHEWVDPTCTEDGYCALCNEAGEAATGHKYNAEVTDPTCTEDGYTTYTCSVCSDTYTDDYVLTDGHKYTDGVCGVCGEADPYYKPECKHEWVDPTCTEDGYCSICKEVGEKATDHNYVTKVVDPTCTEDGYTTYTCSYCGDTYHNDYVGARDHEYIEGICVNCGDLDPYYKPECDHKWIDPTCTEDGYCALCNEAGEAATGHKYTAEVTDPTCTEDGYTTYTCSVCSDTYSSDYVLTDGHKYTDGVCGVCGEADPDYKPECEHEWVDPTCSEDGYCSLCNEKGDKATGIHDYVDGFCTVCNALNPDYVPEVSEGFRFKLSEDETYYILIDVDACDDKYIVIPSEYEGLPVKAIRESAFSNCHTFIHVDIPDSITSIGKFAFAYCNGLTSITIPDSVTDLGEGAFRKCPNLKNVIGGNGITSIGNHTFTDCQNLESITIGNSVTSIGNYAFYDCESLTSIRIPMSVTSIGECAFYYCSSITIYCDAESQPEGWSSNWNYENYPVIWGCHEHTYVDGKCTGCGEADPDYYVVMSITEALAAPDGTNVIVTGTVCTINGLWNGKTNHVTIADNAGNTLYIYGLINEVKLGDIVKVTGTLTTYNGIKETANGCTAEIVGYDDSYGYKEVSIKEATELPDNTNVIITGTVVLINTPYSADYNNISVTIRDDEGNELFIYRLQGDVSVHDVIKITGAMGTHSGVRQLTGGTYEHLYTADCTFTGDGTCQSPKICYCGKVLEGADHVFDDSGRCTVCGFPTPGIHITIAEAIALGSECGHNIFTEGMYYVTGVITEIANFTYGNMYITDGKDTLYIYGVYSQDGIRFDALENQPAVGDTITLYGILGKYNTTIQMKNATIIESGSDDEHSHVWIENERFESTCTTQGYIDHYCTGCDDNYRVDLPLADHNYVDGYCTVCKARDPDYAPEECKHTYIETGRYDGSCSDNGYVNFVCTECGKTYTETLPITEPHNYEETSVPPTCSDRGYIKYTCIACSYTYYDYIPTLDHQWTYPTCEDYECCSVCGVKSGNPPRGHVYEGVNCKYCGYTCADHELELISSLAPTCNTTGNDTYGCKECEYKEHEFHLALGHTWLDGYCSVCGTEKQSEGFVFTFESIGEYWKITGIGSCADTNVIIPDVYEGYPVKHIAKLTKGQMESIVIPDSIVLLDTDAFRLCSKLTEIVIPKNVVSINPACFEGCSSLERIIVADENSYFKSVDGVLYTKDGSTLLFYPGARKNDTLVIPEGLTNIEENAFSQAQYLKYVTIPEGYVKNSDARPFYNCTSIEQVILPSTTEEIYGAMFQGCSNLKWINLPEGLTTIHTSAFEGCSSLTEIIMPDSVAGLGGKAFSGCTSLESVKLSEGLTVIQDDCFYKCVSLTTVIIPDSVTKIEANAFQDCPKLDTFVIGNGIKSIQGYAFKNTYISNVYYNGTAEQWEEILPNISYPNDELTSQTIHFFSESKPTTEGNFWHYVDGVPTLW